jgi:hypothetical protein
MLEKPALPRTAVIPAKAGIQFFSRLHGKLDPGFRRDDD